MKLKMTIIAAAAAFASGCGNGNPFLETWDTPYGIPPFDKIENSHYIPALKEGIRQHNEEIASIIACDEAPTFDNTILPLDQGGELIAKVGGVLFNLSETDATDELQKINLEALGLISEHSNEVYMNQDLFARVDAVYSNMDSLTREQQMVVKSIRQHFVSGGVSLQGAERERMKEINVRLSELSQLIGNNILAANNAFEMVISSPEEIAGLPQSLLDATIGDDSKYHITVIKSCYLPFMAYSENRELRKRLFEAYSMRCNEGGDNDNNLYILEAMALRVEHAHLLGFESPAAEVLSNKMAGNPETVDSFLQSIFTPAVAKAKEEVKAMQKVMDSDIAEGKLPKGAKIEPWDWDYYTEIIRRRDYSLSDEETKPYFRMENVRAGVFDTASRLYGVQFKPITGVALYHPDVEAFEVTDADGSLIGVLLTDYYPRATKRGGAWMNEVVGASGVKGVRPVIVNVGNFTKPTSTEPSLLTIDEVETMFHEFGHAIHGLLTQTKYSTVSGTNVTRDFVELPSQIMENWAFDKEVLKTYARHYRTGEVIPDNLVDRIDAAATFNMGFVTTELAAASILDMKWHEMTSVDYDWKNMSRDEAAAYVNAFEKKAMDQAGLIKEIIPRYRTSYFNHIFSSGYNAGYYGYLWAEVLDKDAFSLFRENGVFDHQTASSFRKNILEAGGSEEPMTLYVRFRGREASIDPLLEGRGLK